MYKCVCVCSSVCVCVHNYHTAVRMYTTYYTDETLCMYTNYYTDDTVHVNTGEGVKKNDINARLCLCAVPDGRDPIEEGHESEPHQGGRAAAEGGRARVEAQAQIFVGTAANRRLAGERESEREREREKLMGRREQEGDMLCTYHIYTYSRAHTRKGRY